MQFFFTTEQLYTFNRPQKVSAPFELTTLTGVLLQRREGSLMSDHSPDWDSQVFLVCVHNVAVDQPYTILQAPTSSCAQDIVAQVQSDSILS